MYKDEEKRNPTINSPVIGDTNRLRLKDDIPLKKKLVESITDISQKLPYLSPVSAKEVEIELEQGYIRALVDDTGEIKAHVRCLPISDEDSFILTLHGKSTEQVVELLRHLSQAKTITLETVNKHLKDLGITEKDLLEAGFERTSLSKLGLRYVIRTNFYYFKNDPIKFIKGFFRKETRRDQFVVFIRRGKI
ncbi:MAG: hypothetical protein Fur0022_27800 [Anaerolineales bacterium]